MTKATSVERVKGLLDRSVDGVNPLPFAIEILSGSGKTFNSDVSAIGFDTNALFAIARHPQSDVIVDSLSRSTIPLVLPGQVIQEFWNNKLNSLDALGKKATDALNTVQVEVDKVAKELGIDAQLVALQAALGEFTSSHKELSSVSLVGAMKSMFEMFDAGATCVYVPRSEFLAIAESRMRSKTPPGFRDAPHLGDFYVWADFLLGLCEVGLAVESPISTQADIYFVSEDRKSDWEVKGLPHPLLTAEVQHLTGATLRVLDVRELHDYLTA